MPASNAARVQASVCSRPTPPEYVSQDPRPMTDSSSSESPSRRCSTSAAQPFHERLGRALEVRVLERARDVVPRGVAVQPHTEPAAVAHVGRHEVALGLIGGQRSLHPGRGGAPQRQPAVAVVVVHERGELARPAHVEAGGAVAEPLARLGEGEADRAHTLQDGGVVDHPRTVRPMPGYWLKAIGHARGPLAEDWIDTRAELLRRTGFPRGPKIAPGDRPPAYTP